MRRKLRKINPNYVTALGMVIAPFIVLAQQIGGVAGLSVSLCLLSLRETTDVLDGWLARFTGQVSDDGKIFDPMVDSLARFSVFAGFLASGWMPLWMVLVIFWRDIIVAYLRTFAAKRGLIVAARPSGKYIKAVPQAVAQIATILGYLLVSLGINLPIESISWWLLLIATVCTGLTAFDYGYNTLRQIKAKNASL